MENKNISKEELEELVRIITNPQNAEMAKYVHDVITNPNSLEDFKLRYIEQAITNPNALNGYEENTQPKTR